MRIPVLVEPIQGNGYRAQAFGLSVDGSTSEEALSRLRELIARRTSTGAQIVSLEVAPGKPPWAEFSGTLKDDPMLADYKREVAKYRKKRDKKLRAT